MNDPYPTRRTRGTPGGEGVILALVAAGFVLGAVPVFLGILNHDVAWLLHAAARVLAGDRLYVDVADNDPPLIVWLSLAPVLLARTAGLSEILVVRILVILLVACSLALSQAIVRRTWPERPTFRGMVLVLAMFVLMPLSGYEFGEREHLLFALILPYLLMASGARPESRSAASSPGSRACWRGSGSRSSRISCCSGSPSSRPSPGPAVMGGPGSGRSR